MNHLPKVKKWLKEDATHFPAVDIHWIPGAPPIMWFVNEYGKKVGGDIDLSQYDGPGIETLLAKQGVTVKTPKPVFKDQVFEATQFCKAWRATGGCKGADGEREKAKDEDCGTQIPADSSGFCECVSGDKLNFDCEEARPPFSCDEMCQVSLADD